MSATLLIIVSWFGHGPVVTTQRLESPFECKAVLLTASESIRSLAATNLVTLHKELVVRYDKDGLQATLTVPTSGREVARLACVDPVSPAR